MSRPAATSGGHDTGRKLIKVTNLLASHPASATTTRGLSLLDANPFLTVGLTAIMRDRKVPIVLNATSLRWKSLLDSWDHNDDLVVVQSDLADQCPLALKVRIIQRLGCTTVVIGDTDNQALVARAIEAGASRVVNPRGGLDNLADTVQLLVSEPHFVDLEQASLISKFPAPQLSDRELQVCCLYAEGPDHTTTSIAAELDRSVHTVRSQLAAGRRLYANAGYEVSTRGALRSALIANGWLNPVARTQ